MSFPLLFRFDTFTNGSSICIDNCLHVVIEVVIQHTHFMITVWTMKRSLVL